MHTDASREDTERQHLIIGDTLSPRAFSDILDPIGVSSLTTFADSALPLGTYAENLTANDLQSTVC